MPIKNNKIPVRNVQEVYETNPEVIERGVRILRMTPKAARVSATIDREKPRKDSVIRNFQAGVLKNFSRSRAKRMIDPVSSVVMCLM